MVLGRAGQQASPSKGTILRAAAWLMLTGWGQEPSLEVEDPIWMVINHNRNFECDASSSCNSVSSNIIVLVTYNYFMYKSPVHM